jgi:hypothetical protein
MAVKILISGLANAGKTSLTKDLPETLVISHDGKAYPYKTPHGTIATFGSTDELINFVSEKVEAYNNKFGKYPKNIVVDSASRVFDTLYDSCNTKYTGFAIYQQLDKEVKKLADFFENDVVGQGVNLVIISHALFDADTNQYNLVGKGSFAKLGGFLSTVDEAVFIETKNDKRIIHFRSTKFPARTLQVDFPDSLPVKDFSLADMISHLEAAAEGVSEFAL